MGEATAMKAWLPEGDVGLFFGLNREGGISRRPQSRWFYLRVWVAVAVRRLLRVPQ